MVSTSRCFDFGGELTLGSLYQKHAAQYNMSSRVVVCVMGRELCFCASASHVSKYPNNLIFKGKHFKEL
jgi:hypothetical protein